MNNLKKDMAKLQNIHKQYENNIKQQENKAKENDKIIIHIKEENNEFNKI